MTRIEASQVFSFRFEDAVGVPQATQRNRSTSFLHKIKHPFEPHPAPCLGSSVDDSQPRKVRPACQGYSPTRDFLCDGCHSFGNRESAPDSDGVLPPASKLGLNVTK